MTKTKPWRQNSENVKIGAGLIYKQQGVEFQAYTFFFLPAI